MFGRAKLGFSKALQISVVLKKSPPEYRARTHSFIYHKHIFFKKIKRLGVVQGSAFRG